MLPSLIHSLALDSASPSPLKRHLAYAPGATGLVALVVIVLVVFLALALTVTFRGLKLMRLSIFLSTLLVTVTVLAWFISQWIVLAVAVGLGLVVSLAPPLRKVGIFFVGMAFGAMVVDLVHAIIILTVPTSSTVSVVALIVTGVVAIGCGCIALAENDKFLIQATSLVGGFTASVCVTVIAMLFLAVGSALEVILLAVGLGVAFAVGGLVSQFGALNKSNAADQSVQIATPVKDDTIV